MSDWSDGYVADMQYTTGFYRELSPVWLNMLAANRGQPVLDLTQPFTWIELGCGQGLSANLLAACYPHAQFKAVDFLPGQVANARRMAAAANLGNVEFIEASFEQLVDDATALPQADFLVLHGVYSWVSPANRDHIVSLAARLLKPGGFFYLSYNTEAGWASALPLRRMLQLHVDHHGGNREQRIRDGLAFCQRWLDGGARFFQQNPAAQRRLEYMQKNDAAYVAHEYLNAHWHPASHADVAASLAAAKLDYLAAAHPADNYDALTVPAGLLDEFKKMEDGPLKEAARELAGPIVFRRDVFVRGISLQSKSARAAQCNALRFTRLKGSTAESEKGLPINCALGSATGRAKAYSPVLQALAAGSVSHRDVVGLLAAHPHSDEPMQVLQLLAQEGWIHPLLPAEEMIAAATEACRAINRNITTQTMQGRLIAFLAVPRIGSAIQVGPVEQAFWRIYEQGAPVSDESLRAAARDLLLGGYRIANVEQQDEAIWFERLKRGHEKFVTEHLPIWRELGIL